MRPHVLLVFLTRFEETSAMLQAIAKYERSHQQWAIFLDDEARAERDPGWLRSKKWHGVISRHTTPELVGSCAELGIPLVDMHDCAAFPGVPKIRPDNVGIGHVGAEHLLERGFRHFGFCGFSNDLWSRERRDGFVEALQLAGHTCDVFDVEYPGDITPLWDEAQSAALGAWMRKLPKPAAVMACMDVRAFQVLSAAHATGILVPEEVAVLGVNNDSTRCELSYPALSSVAPNAFQSGYLAAELLDQMIRGERPGAVDVRVDPIGVTARHSTDVLAVNDKNVAAALSYIREKACSGISVDDILRFAASSRSQLEKKFRRYIGRSPQAEIRRVQMARVKQLLTETDYPLKRIAEITGFEHVEYMCVVFKRITSETPGSFRKRTQAGEG